MNCLSPFSKELWQVISLRVVMVQTLLRADTDPVFEFFQPIAINTEDELELWPRPGEQESHKH